MTPAEAEADVLARVWTRRDTIERYAGVVAIEALTVSGTYPDTVIEVRWQDLQSRSQAEHTLRYPVWHKWSTATAIDVDYLAEDIIEDVYLRAIGD